MACGRRFGDVEGLSWGEVAWGEGERCGADAVRAVLASVRTYGYVEFQERAMVDPVADRRGARRRPW